MYSSETNPLTSAAILHASLPGSNKVIGPMPQSTLRSASHVSSVPTPTGLIQPHASYHYPACHPLIHILSPRRKNFWRSFMVRG